jgi:hypothetical protein
VNLLTICCNGCKAFCRAASSILDSLISLLSDFQYIRVRGLYRVQESGNLKAPFMDWGLRVSPRDSSPWRMHFPFPRIPTSVPGARAPARRRQAAAATGQLLSGAVLPRTGAGLSPRKRGNLDRAPPGCLDAWMGR